MPSGATLKTRNKRNPLIAALDPDPAILKYLQRILSDRFNMSLFTEAAELLQSLQRISRSRTDPDGLAPG